MVSVKAARSFHTSGIGSVRKGQVIEVSEATARAMRDKGLVVDASDSDVEDARAAKEAKSPQNKQAPDPQNKSTVAHELADHEDEYEPGVVRSTANDLGAGGAQPSRPSTARRNK